MADPSLAGAPFNAIAANFAILHGEVVPLLASLRRVLAPDGALVIQTFHPLAIQGALYRDGWCIEEFRGFGEEGAPGRGGPCPGTSVPSAPGSRCCSMLVTRSRHRKSRCIPTRTRTSRSRCC